MSVSPGLSATKSTATQSKRHDVHHVLEQAAHLLLPDPRNLECVPVQMHRMLISAAIPEYEAIALALLNADGSISGQDLLLMLHESN